MKPTKNHLGFGRFDSSHQKTGWGEKNDGKRNQVSVKHHWKIRTRRPKVLYNMLIAYCLPQALNIGKVHHASRLIFPIGRGTFLSACHVLVFREVPDILWDHQSRCLGLRMASDKRSARGRCIGAFAQPAGRLGHHVAHCSSYDDAHIPPGSVGWSGLGDRLISHREISRAPVG